MSSKLILDKYKFHSGFGMMLHTCMHARTYMWSVVCVPHANWAVMCIPHVDGEI